MPKINRLDTFTSNRIAAGEVVERPASIVKELVENAIDAGSTAITVEIRGGGIDAIRVTDNGCGIEPEDCVVAFERHATSKISGPSDLDAIATLGFRGEALSSIAAVAQVELSTRTVGAEAGTFVRIHGGEVTECRPAGCPEGTSLNVEHLFYNTPARLSFLKKPATEAGYIGEYLSRMIMARPEIAFKYTSNGKLIYQSPGKGDLLSAVFCIYGREVLSTLAKVEHEESGIRIEGYVSHSEGAKPSRGYQSFFVNGRYVRSMQLSAAVQEAFSTRLMGGRFPLCVLHITVPFDAVDVNIHPNKMEVRFREESAVLTAMLHAIEKAIGARRVVSWEYRQPESKDVFAPEKTEAKQEAEAKTPPVADWTQEAIRRMAEKRTVQARPSVPAESEEKERQLIDDTALRTITLPSRKAQKETTLRQNLQEEQMQAAPVFDRDLEPYRVIGQIFATYILIEQGNALYLIDQHAAHERILFDQLTQTTQPVASQQLLIPQEIFLTPAEAAVLAENEPFVRQLGFEFQRRQGGRILVTALPCILMEAEGTEFLRQALGVLEENAGDVSASKLKKDAVAAMACKSAIKAHDPLSEHQIEALLAQFGQLGVLNCPHGRPIIIKITKYQLEKLFKRIV